VKVGIPDEQSWWRTSYLPGGYATGWRRAGCLAMIGIAVALLVVAIIAR
jgi:hypothetical protein